ncbi:hypothetical protein [Vibrio cholerae]|uniref:hypothetical protein n=1 Tax=Vibrio cholerae TaxID=666 RepID=UPI0018F0FD5B|nr:hypothetical protein [Vibrio cholerae]MBJ6954333.1 hypothetical protein [Vibrio cholerae]
MTNKIVLFLGNAAREGVTAKLKAVGVEYKRKMLESSLKNWDTILDLFNEYEVTSVIVKMTNSTFTVLGNASYSSKVEMLLENISSKPCLILAHDSLITGKVVDKHQAYSKSVSGFEEDYDQDYDYYYEMFTPPPKELVRTVIDKLANYGLSIIPYEKNVELSVLASNFVDQNESNLIFRIYVPSDRMWAHEAEKFLQLFRDYLHKVSGLSVRHEQYKTNQGVVYEFHGEDSIDNLELASKFDEFSSFMDSCISNPEGATALLEAKSINKIEVMGLIERYRKEARRLHVDIKQERERKLLTIRHSLESELADLVQTNHDWAVIDRLVDSCIPRSTGVSSALSFDRSTIPPLNNMTLNINPQIIETVNGVVAQKINGNQHLGTEARELLELIELYGESNKSILASSVHELVDDSARSEDRICAKHRLKGFLMSIGAKAGDVATGVLQSFIESQIGL